MICRGRANDNELWRLLCEEVEMFGEVDGEEGTKNERVTLCDREGMDTGTLAEGTGSSGCPAPSPSVHIDEGIEREEEHKVCGDGEQVQGRAEMEGAVART
jgi:hypothetical protein